MVELRAAGVAFAEQEQVPVGHGDLLGQAFLGRRQALGELVALLSVEPGKAVLVVAEFPQRREGPGRPLALLIPAMSGAISIGRSCLPASFRRSALGLRGRLAGSPR